MRKMTKTFSHTLKAPIPRTSKRRNKRIEHPIMRTILRDAPIQALFRRLTKRAVPRLYIRGRASTDWYLRLAH